MLVAGVVGLVGTGGGAVPEAGSGIAGGDAPITVPVSVGAAGDRVVTSVGGIVAGSTGGS